MVKKVFSLFLVFLMGLGVSFFLLNQKNTVNIKKVEKERKKIEPTLNSAQNTGRRDSIFVPYWSLEEGDFEDFDRLIYFGVAANENGINKNEAGYMNLSKFTELSFEKEKYLTVRMTDANINFSILENKDLQQKTALETVKTAKDYRFDGIVLDLELFTLFGDEVTNQISEFVQLFYRNSKDNSLRLSVAIYGDAFYRRRPFDVAKIAENSNEIMIMAYDFHKSIGQPGPNFPFEGKDKYGYDFKTMINDFLAVVPQEKLTVIFGMYGYEWEVDEKKRPYKPATSLTLNQIREKYLQNCTFKNCVVLKDKESAETEVNYVATDSRLHIIWFENEDSVKQKKEILKNAGIENYSYWAYGYF